MEIGASAAFAIQLVYKIRAWDTFQVSAPAVEAREGTSEMRQRRPGIYGNGYPVSMLAAKL